MDEAYITQIIAVTMQELVQEFALPLPSFATTVYRIVFSLLLSALLVVCDCYG